VPHCRRRIFAERFGDDVLPTRSRRTARLECIVHHLGLALGGRPAASFAQRLMLPVSNDTLLRVVRRRSCPRTDPLIVAGVDDWAFRKNHRYRTIVCDLERRRIVDFAVNRIQGPASKLPHDGFERPSHCAFGPDGALYVTDFGEIDIAPERAGIRVQAGSGSLWRIRRDPTVMAGEEPPAPVVVPFYLAQYAVWAAGVAAVVGFVAVLRKFRRRSR